MPSASLQRKMYVVGGISGLKNRASKGFGAVLVGLLRNSKSYSNGSRLPAVGYYNAMGTSRIPSRNFIRGWLYKYRVKYTKSIAALSKNVLLAKITPIKARRNLGILGTKDLKQTIRSWSSPPNAQSTVARKGRNDPLVDTGHMVNSINWRHE